MFKAHIKLSVLKELKEESMSGYDIMKYLSEYGENTSPGYIYPMLSDLQKKGFISLKKEGRKKIYSLTKKGKMLLLELEKNKQQMVSKMTKVFSSITDKREAKSVIESHVNLHKNIHKNGDFLKGHDLLDRFHKTLFLAYKTKDLRKQKKIKMIVEDCIKKMENL